MAKKRSRNNNLLVIIFFLALILFFTFFLYIKGGFDDEKPVQKKGTFSRNVITSSDIKMYSLIGDEYIESGIIGKDVELSLNDSANEYYEIEDFKGYYIRYDKVEAISSRKDFDSRYKEYILFNYNVETNDKTIFYDDNDNMVYTFDEAMSFPLIIKDEDKYGIEFNNRLLFIKKENSSLVEHYNTDKSNSSGVGVLNYHAFYDETDPEDVCPTVICHSKSQFTEQLEFLRDNNILTLRMKELEYYVDGKINLPRSVLITIDDGARDSIAVDLLTEYKMYGTIFLVTSWYDESLYYKTDYIELHSHTHNMHDGGKCPGGQGGAIKCLPKEEIQADLKQSREELNGTTYFAYPFYEYNKYSIENLKEAGFTMAFVGDSIYGDDLVHVGDNKFTLSRYVIVSTTTIKDLEKYFNQIK